MKMSFLPGNLHLTEEFGRGYVIRVAGTEVFRSRSAKSAVTRFNRLRNEMEKKLPTQQFPGAEPDRAPTEKTESTSAPLTATASKPAANPRIPAISKPKEAAPGRKSGKTTKKSAPKRTAPAKTRSRMNIPDILGELRAELGRLNRAIAAIEGLASSGNHFPRRGRPPVTTSAQRRGARRMSAAARKRVSEAAKARWAAKTA